MTSTKSPATICIPAHILDADISPRAREVLMLLASQTTPQNPTVWVCHVAIAERLRCSPVTVKRAIQKLVDGKLIDETGELHERRYKFYKVRWSLKEEKTVRSCVTKAKKKHKQCQPSEGWGPEKEAKEWMPAYAGRTKEKSLKPTAPIPPSHPGVSHVELLKDSKIAYWAEIARQEHQENLRRYRMEVQILNRTHPGEFGELNS